MALQAALSSKEKAAILMITLGRDYSAKVFKHLTDEEIEQLTLSITSVRRVEPEIKDEILDEFLDICTAQKYISEGGVDFAWEILDKAMGQTRANEIINKLSSTLKVRPFDFIRRADSSQILNFIQNEHPQTIALILSYLDNKQAAFVLAALPLDKQTSVISRIANMGAATPEYIKEAERILERKLSTVGMSDQAVVGGLDSLVKILNSVDRSTEKSILETLEKTDSELVEEIRNRMFIFEDMSKMDSHTVQRVLKEIDNRDLAIALKGATKDVSKVIFDNITKRTQDTIKEDMEFMGPVRVRDVEEAQQKIVNTIRRLYDTGEIVIARKQEDQFIV